MRTKLRAYYALILHPRRIARLTSPARRTYNRCPDAGVVEWQTRVTQNHLRATAWGFESLLRHPPRIASGRTQRPARNPYTEAGYGPGLLIALLLLSLLTRALGLTNARLQLASAPVAGLLVALMHAGFLRNPAVHDGLLKALERHINGLAWLYYHLNQKSLTPLPVTGSLQPTTRTVAFWMRQVILYTARPSLSRPSKTPRGGLMMRMRAAAQPRNRRFRCRAAVCRLPVCS